MRMVFGLVLLLGLGLAGFAVYMAQGYISAHQAQLEAERAARAQIVPTVDVYITNRQIRYGEPITREDVKLVRWPENAIPQGSFQTEDSLFPDNGRELRVALRAMEKDEALMAIKVSEPGADAGITSRLTQGMRAFAIQVDVTSGVSGFLRPGDRVDVYWTGRLRNVNGDMIDVTKLIEEGLHLVAIDQSADQDLAAVTIARTVTVEVSPQQVAALAQAQATGRLSLSLVGNEDFTVSGPVEVDQNTLLGITVEEVVEAEAERVCSIRTRRGAEVVEIPIPCTN